ncbi:MAG TPA: Rrf2 family transcriptional regulator [Terriglobales bacterium]|nr:Rrf2 family transcriptional regulator [Terriglobales bacterium]
MVGIFLPGMGRMLKLTKKADYGLIAMRHLACQGGHCSAKDIADAYGIPQEALAKILQRLVKAGLLSSHHGTHGGYVLAHDAREISAFDVIKAIDGPLFMTSCYSSLHDCGQSSRCTVREPLRKVSESIEHVLTRMKISDMALDSGDGCHEHNEKTDVAAELVRLS